SSTRSHMVTDIKQTPCPKRPSKHSVPSSTCRNTISTKASSNNSSTNISHYEKKITSLQKHSDDSISSKSDMNENSCYEFEFVVCNQDYSFSESNSSSTLKSTDLCDKRN